jgi:hypothetical protein
MTARKNTVTNRVQPAIRLPQSSLSSSSRTLDIRKQPTLRYVTLEPHNSSSLSLSPVSCLIERLVTFLVALKLLGCAVTCGLTQSLGVPQVSTPRTRPYPAHAQQCSFVAFNPSQFPHPSSSQYRCDHACSSKVYSPLAPARGRQWFTLQLYDSSSCQSLDFRANCQPRRDCTVRGFNRLDILS